MGNIALDAEKKKTAGNKGHETAGDARHGTGKPSQVTAVSDVRVRGDAIACLESAAKAWAANGPANPRPEMIWDQLWFLLEEGGVLKKPKPKK